jgi:hypothetical protein
VVFEGSDGLPRRGYDIDADHSEPRAGQPERKRALAAANVGYVSAGGHMSQKVVERALV